MKQIKFPLIGLSVFLVIRLVMIWSSAAVMGGARLGDDSLLYISKGVGFYHGYSHGSNLEKSLALHARSLSEESELPLMLEKFWRAANQASGGATFTYDAISGILYKWIGESKYVFAIMETIVALIMSVAIYIFIITFWGATVVGLAMLILAPLLLPSQGIHYLIPSTLALSLGLLLVSGAQRRIGVAFIFCLSVLISFLHNIGYIWIVFSLIWLIGCFLFDLERMDKGYLCRAMLALLVPLVVKFILVNNTEFFSINYNIYASKAPGYLTVLRQNVLGFLNYLEHIPVPNRIFLLFLLANAIWAVWSKRRDKKNLLFWCLYAALFVLSLFVYVPFYEGEVAIRILAAASVPLVASFCLNLNRMTIDRALRSGLNLAIAIWIAYSFCVFSSYVIDNFRRPYVLNENKISEYLRTMSPEKYKIALLENEYSLRVLSLLRADNYHYLLAPLFGKQMISSLADEKEVVLVFPVFKNLVSANFHYMNPFKKRQNSIDISLVREIDFESSNLLSLSIVSGRSGAQISFSMDTGVARSIRMEPNQSIEVSVRKQIRVHELKGDAAIVGVSARSTQLTAWPWASDVIANITFNERSKIERLSYDFSTQGILNEHEITMLRSDKIRIDPWADDSGIVFARVSFLK